MPLLEFLHSGLAAVVLVGAAVLVVGALVVWARQPEHSDRLLILGVGLVNTALFGTIYAIAVIGQWWIGAYFETPVIVQAAILIGLSLIVWTLWLSGFRWLSEHSHQSLQIYIAISLLLVLAVAVAHRLNLGQGTILVGPDLTIVIDAVIGLLIMWIPVAIYEALRRALERVEPFP